MNNPQLIQMKKRFEFATAILFAVAIIIMITIPFNRFILPSTVVVAQQQQQINSNTSSSQSTNSESKHIISKAKGTTRAIGIENLKHKMKQKTNI